MLSETPCHPSHPSIPPSHAGRIHNNNSTTSAVIGLLCYQSMVLFHSRLLRQSPRSPSSIWYFTRFQTFFSFMWPTRHFFSPALVPLYTPKSHFLSATADIYEKIYGASDFYRSPPLSSPTTLVTFPMSDNTSILTSTPSMSSTSTSPQHSQTHNPPDLTSPHMSSYALSNSSYSLVPSPCGIQDTQSPYASPTSQSYSLQSLTAQTQSNFFTPHPPPNHQN